MLFRFLLLALLALTLPAEAQQACFGSSCPSSGGGSSTVTSGGATSGFTANSLIWNGASVLGSGPKFLSGNLSLEVGTNYCSDSGANDTYVCTLAGGSLSAYSTGTKITLKANTANTGTATVAVDGLAAITITRRDDSALQTGDISAGDYVPLVYDGNTFRLQRGYQSGVTFDGATAFSVTVGTTIMTMGTNTLAVGTGTPTNSAFYRLATNMTDTIAFGYSGANLITSATDSTVAAYAPLFIQASELTLGYQGQTTVDRITAGNLFRVRDNGSTVFEIADAGAVGFGMTPATNYPLAVKSSGSTATAAIFQESSSTIEAQIGAYLGDVFLQSYDRTAAAVRPLYVAGSTFRIVTGSSLLANTRITVDANGATTIGNSSVSATSVSGTISDSDGQALLAGVPDLNLTSAAPATFAVQTLGNDTGGCTTYWYTVRAYDATTSGLEGGMVTFCGSDVTAGAGGESCSASAAFGTVQDLQGSTLTVAFTSTAGTDLCNNRVTATTDIGTPTALFIKYGVLNSGRTITPQ